jgi:peroxiredoxin
MNQTFKFLILIFLFSFYKSTLLKASDSYEIKIKINGYKDTVCYLAYHYGDKQYMRDTVDIIKGVATFKGEKVLESGIYMFVLNAKKGEYFEFIVNNEPKVELETTYKHFIDKMIVHRSKENEIFYNYIKFISSNGRERDKLRTALKDLKKGSKKEKEIKEKLKIIDTRVTNEIDRVIQDEKDSFYAKVLLAMKEIKIPPAPIKPDGTKDSLFQYLYFKSHFYDYFDMQDDRLLRTPIFQQKLDKYVKNLTAQHPDSLAKTADYLLDLSYGTKDIFRYILIHLLNKYAESKIMGMDKVYVHLVENYYNKGKADWVDSVQLYKIKDRAQRLSYTLIGKEAPPIYLQDSSGKWHNLLTVNSPYTILYLWDADCGHCKKATPKLKKFYDENKHLGIEVYAVNTEVEEDKWKKYIKENELTWINVADTKVQSNFRYWYDIQSTPKVYVLNYKKEIIAKGIGVEQVEDFITKYIKMKKQNN